MASFNKVILMGNLTRDPQLRHLPSGGEVVEFGLAVNRRFTVNGEKREEACFVDCSAFGKPAEIINQYCRKGSAILIEGRLHFSEWTDKQGGGKRSKLSVVVEGFQFLGGKEGGGNRQPERGGQHQSRPVDSFHDEAPVSEDDIPF